MPEIQAIEMFENKNWQMVMKDNEGLFFALKANNELIDNSNGC